MTSLPHIVVDDPRVLSTEDALKRAYDTLDAEKLGGPSGYGWSRYRLLQVCPWRYYLEHRQKIRGAETTPLAVGTLFHELVALWYLHQIDGGCDCDFPTAEDLYTALFDVDPDGPHVDFNALLEARRLYDAYVDRYGHDNVGTPLAVEELAADPATGNTCRYDRIFELSSADARRVGVSPGIWVGELKSASRKDGRVTESWPLDGEVLGQVALWDRAGLDQHYGPLQGVMVDVAIKTKIVGFHRVWVSPPRRNAEGHLKDLAVWRSLETLFDSTGYWPKAMNSCWSGWGKCPHFDRCRDGEGV